MIVTRKYIMKFRTDKGAWTKPQIEALGIDWPPRKGWIDRVVGKELSERSQCEFQLRIGIKAFRKGYDIARQEMKRIIADNPSAGLFEDKKKEALKKYEWNKTEEQLDREALNELNKFI